MLPFDQKYLITDTETEGLNHFYSRPWSVSLVIAQGTRVLEREELFIDVPNLNLPMKLRKLCNFNPIKYKKEKLPASEVWARVSKYLCDPEYRIIGQNLLNYDIYMFNVLQKMAKVKKLDHSYISRIIDTLALGKAYKEGLKKPSSDFFGWQLKVLNDRSLRKRANQKQLLKDFKVPFVEERLHEALYDSEKCFELFLKLKKHFSL